MKSKFNGFLRATEREGVEDLILHLEESGFYQAPCSSQHHLCVEGGLLEHSLNVFECASKMAITLGVSVSTIVLPTLLHDIGKVGINGKAHYVDNILKTGKVSGPKPYKVNDELLGLQHQDLSLIIATNYIELTEDEMVAIKYHNGLYTSDGRDIKGKETPAMLIVHAADMWCARVIEE